MRSLQKKQKNGTGLCIMKCTPYAAFNKMNKIPASSANRRKGDFIRCMNTSSQGTLSLKALTSPFLRFVLNLK